MVQRLRVLFCLFFLALLLPAAAFAAQGELDTTFNSTGFAINGNLWGWGEPSMVAVQKDGKSVVATTYRPEQFEAHFMLLRYNTNGTLDNTFNGTGFVEYNVGHAFATDVAIQKDGKIVVAGMRLNGAGTEYDLMLLRYNTNGSLDTGFGTNGVVIYLSEQWYAPRLTLNKLAIQADGKIVVAGDTSNADGSRDMLLLRYNTNGSLDTGFGTNGVVTYATYVYDDTVADPEVHLNYVDLTTRKVKIMPDGNIAVLIQTEACFFVAKYSSANGALLSETKPFQGGTDVPGYGLGATGQSMDIQEDGKIVVTGEVGQIFVLRYGTDGNFDRTFGTSDPGGANFFDLVEFFDYDEQGGGFSSVFDVVIQPDGKILVTGHCPIDHTGDGFPEEMDLLVLRYTSTGAYDTTFGSGGAFVFDGGRRDVAPADGDRGMSIAIQPDGYIVVAGTLVQEGTDGHYDTLLMRIEGQPLADIDVTPTSYDFGRVDVGDTATEVITIFNRGKASLMVTGIQVVGGDSALFTPSVGTCPSLTPTLTAGSSCTLSVQFSAASVGLKTTTLRITSNDPFDPWKDEVPWDVPLTGTGYAGPVLSVSEGTIGTIFTITGSDSVFGTKKGKVLIGGVATKVTSWTDTLITCTVKKVPFPIGLHDVSITSQTIGTIPLDNAFTVKDPELDTLLDNSGRPGDAIIVTGNFFGTKKGKVYLEYDKNGQTKKKNCKVTNWSMNEVTGVSTLTFVVPKVSKSFPAANYPLKVENKVGIASADTNFTILP